MRTMPTLSIVIPVYNEQATIREVISRVERAELPAGFSRELIIVDDGSTDGTRELLADFSARHRIILMEKNAGKGAAVRRGLSEISGDAVVIQDADLEYDPRDYLALLSPIVEGKADVVYGSRLVTNRPHRVLFFWHYLANQFLTFLSNLFTNLNLTDMETGYKAFTGEVARGLAGSLVSKRFSIEPEITARIKRLRVYEVGISYSGRTYAEGKKIGWKDGVAALYAIVRFNLFG